MKKTIITLAILTITLMSSAQAGKIELKHTFFGGWKYSTDGVNFEGVGMTAKSLRFYMEGNDEAVAEINKYKSRQIVGTIVGSIGGGVVGWQLGKLTWDSDKWTDTDNVIIGVGASLAVVSLIFEASATGHLKEAVRIYNGEDDALLFDLNYQYTGLTDKNQLVLSLRYAF